MLTLYQPVLAIAFRSTRTHPCYKYPLPTCILRWPLYQLVLMWLFSPSTHPCYKYYVDPLPMYFHHLHTLVICWSITNLYQLVLMVAICFTHLIWSCTCFTFHHHLIWSTLTTGTHVTSTMLTLYHLHLFTLQHPFTISRLGPLSDQYTPSTHVTSMPSMPILYNNGHWTWMCPHTKCEKHVYTS